MLNNVPYETTIAVRDSCLCLHIQRAARALGKLFDDALRPVGLTNGQYSLLMAINRPQPPALAPVAELLSMDRTTLTAALKPLERDGLIAISIDPADRRSRLLALTNKGHSALARAVPIWRDTHSALEARLAPRDPDVLLADLLALT